MYYVAKRSSRLSIEIAIAKNEGLIEGKNEAKKEMVQNMKNQGLDDTFIAKCLNISIKELKALLI